jgi:hypothetical protein
MYKEQEYYSEHQDILVNFCFIIGCKCCYIIANASVTRPQPPNSLKVAQLSADYASWPPHEKSQSNL